MQQKKTRAEQSRSVPQVRFPEFKEDWINEQLGKHIKKTDKKNKEDLNLPVYSINNKEGFLPQSEQFDGVNSNDRGFDISIYKIIQPNTFAYNPARINVGSIGYSHNLANVLISSLYVCFQTDDKIDDSFLLAFLDTNHFKTSVLRFQEGGVRQYLFFDNLSKIKLPFPTLPEQQKIAHFFNIIDKKLMQLQEKKDALELYKKGMMQQIFSQKLRFKDNNGKDFPDWEVKKLGEVSEIIGGGTPSTTNKEFWNGEYNWFTPTEIKSDYVTKSKRTITKLGLQKSSARILPIKTILLTTRATIGEVAITKNICTTNQGFQSIVVNNENDTVFIFNWIKRNKYELMKRANGSTFPEVSKKEIAKINIQVPILAEQTKIANFLSKIDDKINTVTKKIEQTKAYKKGLLQKMFA